MPVAWAGAIRASAVAFGMLAAFSWTAGAQANTVILFNLFAPPKHIINTGIAGEWAKAVTKATDGRVTFKIRPAA